MNGFRYLQSNQHTHFTHYEPLGGHYQPISWDNHHEEVVHGHGHGHGHNTVVYESHHSTHGSSFNPNHGSSHYDSNHGHGGHHYW